MNPKEKLLEASYWDSSADKDLIEGYEVLFCAESPDDYEMSLYAVLRKDGKLFELEASHCSCNGYDFSPAEVTAAYLSQRAGGESPYWFTEDQRQERAEAAAKAARSDS